VNAAKDPRFCGSGCTTCSDGDGCQNGSCFTPSCPYGQTFCSLDNKCHNLKTDWATCGSCGKTCDFDESCVDGACLTKGALPCNLLTQCVDNCTNLNADSANCGQCSTPSIYHGCANGEACMAGLCKKLPLAAEPWECGPGKVACNIPADWPTKPAPYYCWTTNCPLGGNPVTPGG
jgi:hypothetical protein